MKVWASSELSSSKSDLNEVAYSWCGACVSSAHPQRTDVTSVIIVIIILLLQCWRPCCRWRCCTGAVQPRLGNIKAGVGQEQSSLASVGQEHVLQPLLDMSKSSGLCAGEGTTSGMALVNVAWDNGLKVPKVRPCGLSYISSQPEPFNQQTWSGKVSNSDNLLRCGVWDLSC